jgi:hypothetical protein
MNTQKEAGGRDVTTADGKVPVAGTQVILHTSNGPVVATMVGQYAVANKKQ